MFDLLVYLTALIAGDTGLLALFVAAGVSSVSIVPPDQRASAAYPRIVIDGDDGEQRYAGENAPGKFFDSVLRLEIVTCHDDVHCPQPLMTLRLIQERLIAVLLGETAYALPTQRGVHFTGITGKKWAITELRLKSGRSLPTTDPKYKRHLVVIAVQLMRAQQ